MFLRSGSSIDASLTVGRIAGAPVKIGPGAVFIALLLAFQLAARWTPAQTPAVAWTAALITAAAFLLSILAHEVGHAVVARRFSVGVAEIRLWFMGGAAAMEKAAPTPRAEMSIAAAGPIVSAVVGVAALGGSFVAGPDIVRESLAWVGVINLILAGFNMLPGLPLDGGRVLTGFLWKRRGDRVSAVRTTATTGRNLGYLAYAIALIEVFVLRTGGGLLTAVVGFILVQGAKGELALAELQDSVRGVQVADVARTAPPTIDWTTNTATARAMLPSPPAARYAIAVDEDGVARGFIDLVRLALAAEKDGRDAVVDIMVPIDQRRATYPSETLEQAMTRGVDVPFVVIDENWNPTGIVTSWSLPPTPAPIPSS